MCFYFILRVLYRKPNVTYYWRASICWLNTIEYLPDFKAIPNNGVCVNMSQNCNQYNTAVI